MSEHSSLNEMFCEQFSAQWRNPAFHMPFHARPCNSVRGSCFSKLQSQLTLLPRDAVVRDAPDDHSRGTRPAILNAENNGRVSTLEKGAPRAACAVGAP